MLGGMTFVWQFRTERSLWVRVSIGGILWSVIGAGLPEALRWVTGREQRASSTTQRASSSDVERLERIESHLKRLGDAADKTALKKKYPLGHVIFEVTETNSVFPISESPLDGFDLDWSVVGITKNTDRHIELRLPNVSRKGGQDGMTDIITGGIKRVGPLGGATFGDRSGGVFMWADILAIRSDGIVFLIGFERAPGRGPA
jgi:hypothetical protein